MPKKLCFTGPFDRQHGKWDETLLQSEREHLYQIYWSLWRKLRWKKSLLVIYKILRRFVSTLTADDKQYLLNRDNLMNPIQMQLSQKQKTFFQFFFSIFESYIKFSTFPEKRSPSELIYSRKYRLRKTWLDKFLKSRVSENTSTDIKKNETKHCCNLNDSTFTMFINHCKGSCIGKTLF